MAKQDDFIPVTDYYRLAVLDLEGVSPARTEWNGRLWAYFPRQEAEKILNEYDSGVLKISARDFVAAIHRVKDRIFERERTERSGADHSNPNT